jgi:hypothetical protein
MPEDITKLPKWAQRRIEIAEREADRLREELAGQFPGTDTFRAPYFDRRDNNSNGIPLPKGETIRFKLGPKWEQYIDCMIRDDTVDGPLVEVRAGYGMLVEPQSSNAIRVRNIR